MNIVALFQCLQSHVTAATLRQLSRIALAMLMMTGRVTMLGSSRWAGKGGGSDIHAMLSLRLIFQQVVIANAILDRADVIG